ncbi:MAG TPA: hypothetical protein VF762_03455, partial [Blastocatellia bacterium]
MESTNQPYRLAEVQPATPAYDVEPAYLGPPRESELSTPRVMLHLVMLALTAVTTTLTGAAWTVQVSDE